jgi:DNA-binding transcriptional regulator LsrR (DeoR family)
MKASFIVSEQQHAEGGSRQFFAAHGDQRPEQIIPVCNHGEYAECCQGRHRDGEHYPPDDLELAESVEARCIDLRRRSDDGSRVVLLCGGLAESTAINPYDNAAMMARALSARCYYVTAPMFAHTEELRNALVSSEPVRSVLAMVTELDIALLSAVDLSEESKALEYGVISRETWRSLRDAGAVGDICGHYLDLDGKPVAHSLTKRVIHPPMSSLLQVPERVLAAGGLQKIPIIRAAIHARLADVLITDETVAVGLLE